MTAKEAIKIISRRTTIPGDGYSFEEINEAIDMAIAALKKWVAKKPEYKHYGYSENMRKIWKAHCPDCGHELDEEEICPNCGRAIDWEE